MNEPQPSLPSSFPPSLPPNVATKNGLSIASLVLGLFSVSCFGLLTGLPAIITGHMARGKARRQPEVYGGGGMALAGLILGYVSIVTTIAILAVAAAFVLPAMAKAKYRGNMNPPSPVVPTINPSVQCVNNLKQIGLAARIWSNDHGDKFPADFLSLSNELVAPKVLVCPGDAMKTQATDWSKFNAGANVSYEFLKPGAAPTTVSAETVFRCPIHGHSGLGDGSVRQGTAPVRP